MGSSEVARKTYHGEVPVVVDHGCGGRVPVGGLVEEHEQLSDGMVELQLIALPAGVGVHRELLLLNLCDQILVR